MEGVVLHGKHRGNASPAYQTRCPISAGERRALVAERAALHHPGGIDRPVRFFGGARSPKKRDVSEDGDLGKHVDFRESAKRWRQLPLS